MARLGQSRHFDHAPLTSDLPRSTDIARPPRLVRFVPIKKIANSLDRLVGTGEQHRWDFDTKRFGCLEIDDQLKLSRLLNGHINHFCASQQLRDLTSALAINHAETGTIADQAAVLGSLGPLPNG